MPTAGHMFSALTHSWLVKITNNMCILYHCSSPALGPTFQYLAICAHDSNDYTNCHVTLPLAYVHCAVSRLGH